MKVGEYFRNKYGIAKVIDIKNNNGIDILTFDKPICFFINKETGKIKEDKLFNQLALIDDIDLSKVKHSQNIIDLIEIGDILSFEDGSICRILEKSDNYYLLKDYGGDQYYDKEEIVLDGLKSIVTKEMFECVEYKVKE